MNPTKIKLHVIFTGGNYWSVLVLPQIADGSDFSMVGGFRWIKSKKAFSDRWQMFACPRHYQTLSADDIKAQGLNEP